MSSIILRKKAPEFSNQTMGMQPELKTADPIEDILIPGMLSFNDGSIPRPSTESEAYLAMLAAIMPTNDATGATRTSPLTISHEDLTCFCDHVAKAAVSEPRRYHLFEIKTRLEAERVLLELRENSTAKACEEISLARLIADFDFSNPKTLAFAAGLEAGKAHSICLATRENAICPEPRTISYDIELELLFTASQYRSKGLGAAALWPVFVQIFNDISAFSERCEMLAKPFGFRSSVTGAAMSDGGARALESLYARLLADFNAQSHFHPSFRPEAPKKNWAWPMPKYA
jgi:hypothetical protein